MASARKTSRVIVLHEAPETGGFGGEIAAAIGQDAFDALDAPVTRVAGLDMPVPFSKKLEAIYSPQGRLIAGDTARSLRIDRIRRDPRGAHKAAAIEHVPIVTLSGARGARGSPVAWTDDHVVVAIVSSCRRGCDRRKFGARCGEKRLS